MKLIQVVLLIVIMLPTTSPLTQSRAKILNHDGIDRIYYLFTPKNVNKDDKLPLVIALHGGKASADSMERKLAKRGFNQLADENGFIVAYPEGVNKTWNDGRNNKLHDPNEKEADDVGFISKLIDFLVKEANVDKNKIYVTGISNGGFMSLRLACELSDKIIAVAPVTATLSVDLEKICSPKSPVSIMLINGTEDPLVPFQGGQMKMLGKEGSKILSTEDTVKFWVKFNKCNPTATIAPLPDIDPDDGTRVIKTAYSGCNEGAEVILYTIEGGGHTWPGGNQYLPKRLIGNVSYDINACDVIWEFFNNHNR